VLIAADPVAASPWRRLHLRRYRLDDANDAIDDVAAGRVIKALIDPRLA
jgi:Zn-dependent alcohol dehydrogenase